MALHHCLPGTKGGASWTVRPNHTTIFADTPDGASVQVPWHAQEIGTAGEAFGGHQNDFARQSLSADAAQSILVVVAATWWYSLGFLIHKPWNPKNA